MTTLTTISSPSTTRPKGAAGGTRTTGSATARPATTARPGATGQAVVDGALLLPRAVVATRALLSGAGVETYRSAFPVVGPRDGLRSRTSSPSRIATHVVAGFLLGLLTLAVVGGLIIALLASPLLLAPAGGAALLAFAGIGAGHGRLTRRLVDRT